MGRCNDPESQTLRLIRQFQRTVLAEGLLVECDALHDPIRLRGRVTEITDEQIKVRLTDPCHWRIEQSTSIEYGCMGYRPLIVDLDRRSVELSQRARIKVEFMLQLAWGRAKFFGMANTKTRG